MPCGRSTRTASERARISACAPQGGWPPGPPPPPKTTSLGKAAWCCLRNPDPGAGRHPQPLGCRGRWPRGGREYEAAAPPRLSRRVEGVRVRVGLGAVPVAPRKRAQTRRPKAQPKGLREARRTVGCRGRAVLVGGLGVKALEPHWRRGHYQTSPGLGCLAFCCCAGDAPVSQPIDSSPRWRV